MLGRKKKILEDFSFLIDAAGAVVIIVSTFLALTFFRQEWETVLSTLFGWPFRIDTVMHLKEDWWVFCVIFLHTMAGLQVTRFYQLDLFAGIGRIAFEAIKSNLVGLGMTVLFFYFFNINFVNRSFIFGFAGSFLCFQIVKEIAYRHYLIKHYYRRRPLEAILVCPASDVERRLKDFAQRHLSGVAITGIVLIDPDDGAQSTPVEPWRDRILGRVEDLSKILSQGRFDMLFLGDTHRNSRASQIVLTNAEEQGVEAWYFADFLTPLMARPHVDECGGRPVIVFNTTSHYEGRFVVKRLFDIAVASGTLLAISPVFAVIAFLIKRDSEGPIFFFQERTGLRGKPFRMLKFRTMVTGAENRRSDLEALNEMSGPVFKAGEDPRITAIGRFLRRYSLDELPQLLNVLRGEMSLVGPRPLPVYETQNFEAFKDHRRYSVLPGLTGLWQVSGRNRISDFKEWVRLDLEYIDRWSLWLDVVILLRTVPVVLSGDGAK